MSDQVYERCGARARKGNGEGTCNYPLDECGQCGVSGSHLGGSR